MAPTIVYADGFEHQNLATPNFQNAGSVNLYATIVNATIETTASLVRTGAASLKCAPTGAAAGEVRRPTLAAGSRIGVMSVYLRIAASLPAGANHLLLCSMAPTTGSSIGILYRPTTGKFVISANGPNGSSTQDFVMPAVEADRWYLVELKADFSANTFVGTGRIDQTWEQTASFAGTAVDIANFRLGTPQTAGPAASIYYDDWVCSLTSADYPIGHHFIERLLPTSDGTHNAGTNVIENQALADIGAVTAFDLVNEAPAEATDYIQQSATGAANYVEIVFANPSATPWGTEYVAACEGAAANASDLLFRVTSSGGSTLLDIGGTGAVSGTTRRYSASYLAGDPTGNRGRIGFATDVSPIPRALQFLGQAVIPSGVENFTGVGIPI